MTVPDELELLPGPREAVRALHAVGLRIVLVTNQRAIALGLMDEGDLRDVHRALIEQLGGCVDATYHCPHDRGECECRKPRPGMFHAARQDAPAIDFRRSVMIGDSPGDMAAGRSVGCRLVLLSEGRPAERVDHRAASLSAAAKWLLRAPASTRPGPTRAAGGGGQGSVAWGPDSHR